MTTGTFSLTIPTLMSCYATEGTFSPPAMPCARLRSLCRVGGQRSLAALRPPLHARAAIRSMASAVPPRANPREERVSRAATSIAKPPLDMEISPPPTGMAAALFLEVGVGTDQHGQDLTKACVRAVKDAISFNSIPSLHSLVPGGRDHIVLRLQLAVPFKEGKKPHIDLEKVCAAIPYGTILPVEVTHGGARFESMCSVPSLGDTSDGWVVAIACVTVGY